ncbi:MAG TPA: gliding motility lipoprotein GldB [Chryseosolibacter sp.]|nr:gliding motility lipoprotein GldB [Chryseosolibacter sp.]
MRKLSYILLAFLLWNCGKTEKEECVFRPEVSAGSVSLIVEHFEDTLANIKSKGELIRFLGQQPLIRDEMFRRAEYPNDSVFINELFKRLTNTAIDTLLLETKRVFGDGSGLEARFKEAFANLRYYYPDFVEPKVKTMITGLDTDLFVSDTLIMVSLDFFLGPDASYRPKTYDYLMRRYDPEDIVPSCLLIYGISDRFNKTNLNDRSVLADMVAYGKSFYFTKHMLPCTPDSLLIWYTADEMSGARQNEDLIWARFVQDKVLFSTNMIDKKNYLGDRPITTQVGEKCPGRIGQWVGWQIVKEYMNTHPQTSLQELMNMADAQALFKNSNYKPQNR